MKEKDVEKILNESTQKDWIINDQQGEFTYRDDLNLKIQRAKSNEFREFTEEWTLTYPDKHAKAIDYKVFYNNSLVQDKTLVSVDGHKAIVPMPESSTNLNITANDLNLAKIVDVSGLINEYVDESNLKIKKDNLDNN